jgi:uncharacterized protein (DUF697 family)
VTERPAAERAADRALGAEQVEAIPSSLWERIRSEPERSVEHLALAAAERFAAPAARWAALMLPHHTPAEAARTACRKHVRLAGVEGAALGLGGAVTSAADVAALAWIQSRMVFFIAAAHGFDPGHPMRPAELLALQGIYDTPAEARAALDGIGTPLAVQVVGSRLRGRDGGIPAKLLRFVGRRVARRYALKAIPLVASPVNAVQNVGATRDLGKRALAYYGGDQARP